MTEHVNQQLMEEVHGPDRVLWLRGAHEFGQVVLALGVFVCALGVFLAASYISDGPLGALVGGVWFSAGVAAAWWGLRATRTSVAVTVSGLSIQNVRRRTDIPWSAVAGVETWPRSVDRKVAPSAVLTTTDGERIILGASALQGMLWSADTRRAAVEAFAHRLTELNPSPEGGRP